MFLRLGWSYNKSNKNLFPGHPGFFNLSLRNYEGLGVKGTIGILACVVLARLQVMKWIRLNVNI